MRHETLDRPIAAVSITYERAKELARDPDPKVRRDLAGRADLRPEVLYYLAEDAEPSVRRAIAANKATPGHANLLLARDADDEVRVDLARKIGRLLPELSPDQSSRVRELALQAIEVLAKDQLPRVRAILAEELKHAVNAPVAVIRALAEDVEAIVSAPILEYSPLLSDIDLLEIIHKGAVSERLAAIARRLGVTAPVSDAIVQTLDTPAVATLLGNNSAQIREETLDAIVDHAPHVELWHEPLVQRAELSVRAMRRIAGFVAASLIQKLADRHDLDESTQRDLRDAVQRRLNQSTQDVGAPNAIDRAKSLHAAGRLDDQSLVEALDKGERDFAFHALSLASGLTPQIVGRVIQSRSAKAVTALVWRCGFSMRTAMRVQLKLALIPPQHMLNARNGVDYPLTQADLEQQLSIFVG